ncbi:MAG: inositol monophosphatase family protein [Dehalococcoidales bacterium]|nr:inositol monophosphatase family protein [Dehalococcoidales bacterium]
MDTTLEIAANAAREAGAYLVKSFRTAVGISYKDTGHANPCTSADRGAEELVLKVLSTRFPEHAILSEEKGRLGPESEYTWIIDPLDGTVNFMHGYGHFAVSIALACRDEVVLGVVFNPATNELFAAEKGKGAFLNDSPIRVSRVAAINESLLAISFPYDRDSEDFRKSIDCFTRLLYCSQALRRDGSTALALCNVACGRVDGFCVSGNQPWDYAAGTLLVTEAGGRVTDFNGRPFNFSLGQVLATNGILHESMMGSVR